MLVDAQRPRTDVIDLGQGEEAGLGQCGADRPPGDGERSGCFGDGPAGIYDRVNNLVSEPGRGAGTARDLGGGFIEREPRAGRFLTVLAVLGPADLHGSGDGDVLDPLEAAFLSPRRHNTAARAARWLVGLDDDLAAPIGQQADGHDAVARQVEDASGSVGRHNDRLVVLFLVEC